MQTNTGNISLQPLFWKHQYKKTKKIRSLPVFTMRAHNCQASGKTDFKRENEPFKHSRRRFSGRFAKYAFQPCTFIFFQLFDIQWIALKKKGIENRPFWTRKNILATESASWELSSSNMWFVFHLFSFYRVERFIRIGTVSELFKLRSDVQSVYKAKTKFRLPIDL